MKEEVESFLEHLALNENASDHTVRAYESDLSQFLTFLAQLTGRKRMELTAGDFYLGAEPSVCQAGAAGRRYRDGVGRPLRLHFQQLVNRHWRLGADRARSRVLLQLSGTVSSQWKGGGGPRGELSLPRTYGNFGYHGRLADIRLWGVTGPDR